MCRSSVLHILRIYSQSTTLCLKRPDFRAPRVVAYEKADCIFYSLQVAVSVRLVFVRNETTYTLLEESLMIWPHTYLMCVLVSGLLYLR